MGWISYFLFQNCSSCYDYIDNDYVLDTLIVPLNIRKSIMYLIICLLDVLYLITTIVGRLCIQIIIQRLIVIGFYDYSNIGNCLKKNVSYNVHLHKRFLHANR